ncbi:MAG: hypothetical protein ABT940_00375 [Alphaproteobacteria bacterium]|nr:hypothetical protein [Magnetococcales bacterium]
MIPVPNPIPEPDAFDLECRQAGNEWLNEHPDCKRPRDFWSPFRNALADGFDSRCGYGAMWISSGTVDHFVSIDEDKTLAYEWKNYRYLDSGINSSKNNAKGLLDPFVVEKDWFEILLPSLQLVLTDAVPQEFLEQAQYTIKRLKLQDHETLLRTRRMWYQMYLSGKLTIDGLKEMAPLIAAAVEKQENAMKNNGEREGPLGPS